VITAEGEANATRIRGNAESDSLKISSQAKAETLKIEAKANADAKVVAARATADARRLEAEALADSYRAEGNARGESAQMMKNPFAKKLALAEQRVAMISALKINSLNLLTNGNTSGPLGWIDQLVPQSMAQAPMIQKQDDEKIH